MRLLTAWWLLTSLGSMIYSSSYFDASLETTPVLPPIVVATENEEVQIPPPPPPQLTVTDTYQNVGNTDEIVEKILQSPQILNIINNYHSNIQLEQRRLDEAKDEKLMGIINELREEIGKAKATILQVERVKNDDVNRILAQFRAETAGKLRYLTQRMNRCCNKAMIDIEPFVTRVLTNLLNDGEFLSNQKGLSDWLHALFVAKQDLEWRLSNLTQSLPDSYDVPIEHTAQLVMEKVVTKLSHTRDSGSISDDRVREIVKSTLAIYDADKTGLVDYAMEPMGGQVITTRCTENYHSGTAVISIMGVPLWYPTNSPRTVITPGINPGECWAFQNFPGFLVIKLANRVKIEAFSLEHISRLLVPEGRIDSAPKEFEVYGLEDENDRDPVKIGDYVYDYDGDSIQYFAAQQHGLVFGLVEVRIKSNHGNPNYTCLYRFRVHGSVSENT